MPTRRADGHHRRHPADAGAASRSPSPCRRITAMSSASPRMPPRRTPRTRSTPRSAAAPEWAALSFDDRAAIFLRAADLLAGPWRSTLNAATMLGQAKTVQQAEIDAACELIDFWRFNVGFARQILADQPISSPGVWNRTDYRPLDGFVYAITPVQLHRDRRQPAHRAGADGQHGDLEAEPDPAARRALHPAAPRGGRTAARRDQHAAGRRACGLGRGARAPRSRRHPFHRLDGHLPAAVADRRRQHRRLPQLPADCGGDRRQGLRGRAPERRPGRRAHRAGARRLRVLRPEVLGRVTGLRRSQSLAAPRG